MRVLAGGVPLATMAGSSTCVAARDAAPAGLRPAAGARDMTAQVDFPYHVDGRGRTAGTGDDDHLRDLIEQVLFTAPGERVMRPDFGSGLLEARLRAGWPGARRRDPASRPGRAPAVSSAT